MSEATPQCGRSGAVEWPGKPSATVSNGLASGRRRTWALGVLPQVWCGPGLAELPKQVRELLLATRAPAA